MLLDIAVKNAASWSCEVFWMAANICISIVFVTMAHPEHACTFRMEISNDAFTLVKVNILHNGRGNLPKTYIVIVLVLPLYYHYVTLPQAIQPLPV